MPFPFFTRPNFEDRQVVQYTGSSITLSGDTNIDPKGNLRIYKDAFPGLVATSLDSNGTVVWGPISGISWSISACTSPLYVNNIVACPSTGDTIQIDAGNLALNGELNFLIPLSAGTTTDNVLVIDGSGFIKSVPQSSITPIFTGGTGTCITDLYVTNIHGCSPITIWDQLQHNGSTASGLLSTALGYQTIALGDYSFVQGTGSTAVGAGTIVLGNDITGTTTNTVYTPNITVQSGRKIHSQDETKNTIYFGTLGNEYIGITQDDEGYIDPYLYLDPTIGDLGRFGGFDNSSYGFSVVGAVSPGYDSAGIRIVDNTNGMASSTNFNNVGVFVGSKDSLFLSGITNSVVIGGINITATTNSTAYVPNLNINNTPVVSTTGVTVLVRNTNTGDVESADYDNRLMFIARKYNNAFYPSPDPLVSIPTIPISSGCTYLGLSPCSDAVTITNFEVSKSAPGSTPTLTGMDSITGIWTVPTNGFYSVNMYAFIRANNDGSNSEIEKGDFGNGYFTFGLIGVGATYTQGLSMQVVPTKLSYASGATASSGSTSIGRTSFINFTDSKIVYLTAGAQYQMKVLNNTQLDYIPESYGGSGAHQGLGFSVTKLDL